MSSKAIKRRSQNSSMENGDHVENAETNGTTVENEELKGFSDADVCTAKGMIKDVTVVLTRSTPIEELDAETEQKEPEEEQEKRVTHNQVKENEQVDVETVEEEEKQVASNEETEVEMKDELERRVTRSQTKENEDVETNEGSEEVTETSEAPKENGEKFVDLETKEVSDAEKDTEPDETEPELMFDENSDRDSGKNSPASRCLTRRSHLRQMPTPKTPKLLVDSVKTPTPPPEELVDLNESDDLSTQAVVGNDTTRANFTVNEEDQQPSEFFKSLKDKSLTETLRSISSRRTIHPRHERHITRSEFHVPYPKRASVESISGLKRKHRSPSPEDNKRMKRDSSGLFSYIKSPVFGVKHHFSKDLPSSTPKLTGFRNKNSLLDSEEISKIKLEVEDTQPEKKWCSIM